MVMAKSRAGWVWSGSGLSPGPGMKRRDPNPSPDPSMKRRDPDPSPDPGFCQPESGRVGPTQVWDTGKKSRSQDPNF